MYVEFHLAEVSIWETVSHIATAISALLAAGALGAGFLLYRINRRDDEIANLRITIAASRASVNQLTRLVGYELADELATAAVYSRSMEVPLRRVYEAFIESESSDDPEKKINSILGKITVAIDSEIAQKYEDAVRELAANAAKYQTTYPGLYRVLQSQTEMYRNVLGMEKRLIRDEDQWTEALVDVVKNERSRIGGLDDLQYELVSRLIAVCIRLAAEVRKELGDLKEIFDLVSDAYMAFDERSLVRIARAEQGESLVSVSATETLPEDLREAEKALQHVLGNDERLKYRELVTRFENRRKTGDE